MTYLCAQATCSRQQILVSVNSNHKIHAKEDSVVQEYRSKPQSMQIYKHNMHEETWKMNYKTVGHLVFKTFVPYIYGRIGCMSGTPG